MQPVSPWFDGAVDVDGVWLGHDLSEVSLARDLNLHAGRALDAHAKRHADSRRDREAGIEELDVLVEVDRFIVGEPDEEVEVVGHARL